MQPETADKWLKAPEAAQRLGLTEKTLLDIGVQRLEIQRGNRVIRRYRESVIKEFEARNAVAA